MKKHWIEWSPVQQAQPMSYWVHHQPEGESWHGATAYEPPLPRAVIGKGYPVFCIEAGHFTFRFASLDELDVCIATLEKPLLPTPLRLVEERGTGYGLNHHWLSRLPGDVKAWRYRQKMVPFLRLARAAFARELAALQPKTQ